LCQALRRPLYTGHVVALHPTESPLSRRGALAPAAQEIVIAFLLLLIVTAVGSRAWRTYDEDIRPHARQVAVPGPAPSIRGDDPKAVQRFQRITDLLGEAQTYRNAKRQDWADETLARAAALDPADERPASFRARWESEPIPELSADEAAVRNREQVITELLGAANTFVEAGEQDDALELVTEVLALDPSSRPAQDLAAKLRPL
jgi:hypothetical protein